MKNKYIFYLLAIFLLNTHLTLLAQSFIKGQIIDKNTQETLIGASVVVLGENRGTSTDFDGYFELTYNRLPITIECSYMGYTTLRLDIEKYDDKLIIKLSPDKLILDQINVVDTRLTEKLKQSPVTIEAMDITAIKEAPSSTFYESIGNLKGVDLTSASLGFKIINTRGFNSTSPVRSLQIIDGVDNQSPGLNFSLGNFLGTTELDTKGVEIIVGANSALYGPNAFNGVISMSTKDPFMFPGSSYQIKMGEQSLTEHCFRYARNTVLKNDIELGFKINIQHMKANDWEANNFNRAYDTESPINNPGGYDAVNIYGDEYNRSFSFTTKPGMGTVHRNGYLDSDLVDYDTENLKFNSAIHIRWINNSYNKEIAYNNKDYYWLKKRENKNEFIYSFNYGNGTTIYQGDNRISLKNIQFFQNRIEFKRNDNFFIRLYSTHEDAGDSYDAIATAVEMLDKGVSNEAWYAEYSSFWSGEILDLMVTDLADQGYISQNQWIAEGGDLIDWINLTQSILNMNPDLLAQYHDLARENANKYPTDSTPFIEPGTEEFNTLFNEITTQTRYDEYGNFVGGTQFYDKSSLYHIHAEKKIDSKYGVLRIGANGRLYNPESNGSIFNDGYDYVDVYELDENGEIIYTESIQATFDPNTGAMSIDTILVPSISIDTIKVSIQNYEYGFYMGYDKKLFSNTLMINGTARLDKNQNFDYVFSPAGSMVYKPNERDVIRLSLSSAVRNPTLTDQYFDYNQGQAILLGNLNGFGFNEYFVSIDSLLSYFRGENELGGFNKNALKGSFIRVDPIQPEQVKTAEIGFRTTLLNKLYIDASYYYSVYRNFIGYQIGATYQSAGLSGLQPATQEDVDEGWAEYVGEEIEDYLSVSIPSIEIYRIAANAKGKVTAQGFSIGLNYYFNEKIAINGNYSWNKLINEDSKDPIIPAYNTPEHKFNIGVSNKLLLARNEYNISLNYKWQEEFVFEGSPQFTGQIPSYGLLDAQINRIFKVKDTKLTAKIGGSNILNNQVYQAYGGPTVGRLAYISLTFDY